LHRSQGYPVAHYCTRKWWSGDECGYGALKRETVFPEEERAHTNLADQMQRSSDLPATFYGVSKADYGQGLWSQMVRLQYTTQNVQLQACVRYEPAKP
jgi:hypothetical protein